MVRFLSIMASRSHCRNWKQFPVHIESHLLPSWSSYRAHSAQLSQYSRLNTAATLQGTECVPNNANPTPAPSVPLPIAAQGGPLLVKSLCSKTPGSTSLGWAEAYRDHSIIQLILKVTEAWGRVKGSTNHRASEPMCESLPQTASDFHRSRWFWEVQQLKLKNKL